MQANARRVAEAMAAVFAPACSRIEIAGSIRREVPWVKDIELVAMPKPLLDLFGEPLEGTQLDLILGDLLGEKRIEQRIVSNGQKRWGRRHKAIFAVRPQMALDLFLVHDEAAWGGCLAIRTGPAEYSKALVTSALRQGRKCRGNILHDIETDEPIATPDERSFIEACGMDWREPRDR